MRFYDIQAGGLHYTSIGASGGANPGALQMECDISVSSQDVPLSGSTVTVWGIGLADISQAQNLFDQPFSMSAGMSAGLPLANPAQAGPLLSQAKIYRAFGNWVGTEQSITFQIIASTNAVTSGGQNPKTPPKNIVLNWPKGQALAGPLQQALSTAFPDLKVDMKVGQLMAMSDQIHFSGGLEQFAHFLRRATQDKTIAQGATDAGVGIVVNNGTISVADGSMPTSSGTIAYQDLIGQPTWIAVDTIQIKVVMRADIHVNDKVVLPRTVVTNTGAGSVIASGSALSPQTSLTFQGTFMVQNIRHVGNFRQPDAAAWCTIIEATTISGGA